MVGLHLLFLQTTAKCQWKRTSSSGLFKVVQMVTFAELITLHSIRRVEILLRSLALWGASGLGSPPSYIAGL